MVKKPEIRNYNVSDAALLQLGDLFVINVNRDILDFNTRGVTASTVTALGVLITTLDTCPTDEEYLGPVIAATDSKNEYANQLKIALRPIRNMADLKYNGRGKYTSFGFKDMAKMTDDELTRHAKRIVRVGTTLLSEMASEGLTAAMLTNITNLVGNLNTAIDTRDSLIEDRDIATLDRITKGNALYAEIVRLASIGQSLYIDTNEAKYNDYVLKSSPTVVIALQGLIEDSETHEPLADVNIEIPELPLTLISDIEGEFEIETLAPGSYSLICNKLDYQPFTQPIIKEAGIALNVTILLTHN